NSILKGPDDRLFFEKVDTEADVSSFMNATELGSYKLGVAPEGATALYDGIALACDKRMRPDEPRLSRRALIVLSDGEDTASHLTRDAAIAKAIEDGVVIFAVSTA